MVKRPRTALKQPAEPIAVETYAEFIENSDEVVMDEEDLSGEQDLLPTMTGNIDAEDLIMQMKTDAEAGSFKALKRLVAVYGRLVTAGGPYDDLSQLGICTALQSATAVLQDKLATAEKRSKHSKSFGPVLKGFLNSTIKLLRTSEDYAILAIEKLTPLASSLKAFPVRVMQSLSLAIVKLGCRVWGSAGLSGKQTAIDFIKAVAEASAVEIGEVYRSLFTSFAKNSKLVTLKRFKGIEFMRNCFVDVLATNLPEACLVLQASLKQLGLHLSAALTKPTNARVRTIYTAQFFQSLSLIAAATMRYQKELTQLQSPLVQVALGLLKLPGTLKYCPLRLQVIRLLTDLEAKAKTYFPGVTPYILEILQSQELKMRSKPDSRLKPVNFRIATKVAKENVMSLAFKEQAVQECCDALLRHVASFSMSISFPEVVLPLRLALKKHCKDLKHPGYNIKLTKVCKQLTDAAIWSETRRNKLGLAPQAAPALIAEESPLVKALGYTAQESSE